MIRWNKLIALIAIILSLSLLMAFTSNYVVRHITLGLDLQGGFEVLYQASPLEGEKVTSQGLKDTVRAIERRINVLGVTEPEINIEGQDRIRVKLAGVTNQDAARELLGKPARLTFRNVNNEILLDGKDLVQGGAKVDVDTQTNQPVVQLKLKDANKFRDITSKYLGQPIGIYLDEDLITNPTVQSVITTGTAVITGQESVEKAQELADLLNAGALPLQLKEIQSQSVGASLGMQALQLGVKAGIIGTVLILLFMILYYRLPGFIASFTLVFYIYLILVVFWQMHVTLTLPGIAALVLGIGMAVDANIISYERIKEELRAGRSLMSAIRVGYQRSFATILDSNLTTIIAALVLFIIGEFGQIKGFAITLIVSILVSMVTAVFGARLLINLFVKSNLTSKTWLFGVKEAEIREL
ncbi:SecD/SecF fusion protein [Tepidibacillus fermentans]|uniref:Protein translocase subunit SecD n=1 Tax=Tepidibacillus fermentans TaxID=1281767 RepID=A0A4V2UT23_9BACI|nr:protein translocase subunit SecD [Tepidibacillus fermentans]TCS83834.1 SecD/SecF fusion protein [Tepidibacillus fermentans]